MTKENQANSDTNSSDEVKTDQTSAETSADQIKDEQDSNATLNEEQPVMPPQGDPFGAKPALDLEQKLSDMNSKYLYAVAELDNTRKRHIKERSDLMKYAGENMARDFLEVMDDLERAANQSAETDTPTILEGINLISNRMRTLFERYGIKGEECLGESFDPKKHEALTMSPSSADDSGKIIQQISRPYYFKDKLLRPGQVIVGNGESAKTGSVSVDEKA